jgi:hypothetical protein
MMYSGTFMKALISFSVIVACAAPVGATGDILQEAHSEINVQSLMPTGMPVRFDGASATLDSPFAGGGILRYRIRGTENDELASLYVAFVVVAPDDTVRASVSQITRRKTPAKIWDEAWTLTADQVRAGDRVVVSLIAAASLSTLWQAEQRPMAAAALALAKGEIVTLPAAQTSLSWSGNIRPK